MTDFSSELRHGLHHYPQVLPSSYPSPQGWDQPDRDTTSQASPLGAAGTYNHLVDAVTDVAATRAMLMRRVRTLTEAFLAPNGRLTQVNQAVMVTCLPTASRIFPLP
jgi:hypothetical protein